MPAHAAQNSASHHDTRTPHAQAPAIAALTAHAAGHRNMTRTRRSQQRQPSQENPHKPSRHAHAAPLIAALIAHAAGHRTITPATIIISFARILPGSVHPHRRSTLLLSCCDKHRCAAICIAAASFFCRALSISIARARWCFPTCTLRPDPSPQQVHRHGSVHLHRQGSMLLCQTCSGPPDPSRLCAYRPHLSISDDRAMLLLLSNTAAPPYQSRLQALMSDSVNLHRQSTLLLSNLHSEARSIATASA